MWCDSKTLQLNKLKNQEIVQTTANALFNKILPLMGAVFPMIGLLVSNGESFFTKTLGTVLIFSFMLMFFAILSFCKGSCVFLRPKH